MDSKGWRERQALERKRTQFKAKLDKSLNMLAQWEEESVCLQLKSDKVLEKADECKAFLAEDIYKIYGDEIGSLSATGQELHNTVRILWEKLSAIGSLLVTMEAERSDADAITACMQQATDVGVLITDSAREVCIKKAAVRYIADKDYLLVAQMVATKDRPTDDSAKGVAAYMCDIRKNNDEAMKRVMLYIFMALSKTTEGEKDDFQDKLALHTELLQVFMDHPDWDKSKGFDRVMTILESLKHFGTCEGIKDCERIWQDIMNQCLFLRETFFTTRFGQQVTVKVTEWQAMLRKKEMGSRRLDTLLSDIENHRTRIGLWKSKDETVASLKTIKKELGLIVAIGADTIRSLEEEGMRTGENKLKKVQDFVASIGDEE